MKSRTAELPIVLVDDEAPIVRSLSLLLRAAGYENLIPLSDSRGLLELAERRPLGLILLDLAMPGLSGEEALEHLAATHPEVPVIIVTASQDVSTAVQAMRTGAVDYLVKPIDSSQLVAAVSRALETRALREELASVRERLLSRQVEQPGLFSGILTEDPVMLSIFRYVEAIGPSPQPVLITGETGTGKELVARAVHGASGRTGEFVAVNVAGLEDPVFSDTLFGHRKGAFTGAERARSGLLARAAGGTLFLDEIGDLEEPSQIKLLRLLQERTYYPLGADDLHRTDARIVVATHYPVEALLESGRMRRDLYYRLHTHHVHLPPLRERPADLALLATHLVEKAAAALGKPPPALPPEFPLLLRSYEFPGNVRELEALVFDAVARHEGGVLSLAPIRARLGLARSLPAPSPARRIDLDGDRLPTLKEMERLLLEEALRRSGGNQGIAAEMLGLTRHALNKRLVRGRKEGG